MNIDVANYIYIPSFYLLHIKYITFWSLLSVPMGGRYIHVRLLFDYYANVESSVNARTATFIFGVNFHIIVGKKNAIKYVVFGEVFIKVKLK